MEFVNDPIKSKRVFILMLILAIVFLVCAVFFGYFSYSKNKENSDLRTQNDELQKSLESSTSASDKTKTGLEKDKADLEKEVSNYEDKIDMITKYNEFLKYMTQVIDAHDGYTGWTDAEYQVGRQKAVATGNQDFINDVDSAWNDTTIDPVTRALRVYYDIVAGIEDQTK